MGNLSTPKSVQKLQVALHAKAKAEAGYRFYALYDKIGRDDILAHAYAQCRSNNGAPGVDGQDFADIEAHGVQRWLGELALALRQETYRPDAIRRVFIAKAGSIVVLPGNTHHFHWAKSSDGHRTTGPRIYRPEGRPAKQALTGPRALRVRAKPWT